MRAEKMMNSVFLNATPVPQKWHSPISLFQIQTSHSIWSLVFRLRQALMPFREVDSVKKPLGLMLPEVSDTHISKWQDLQFAQFKSFLLYITGNCQWKLNMQY
jgi:hypothetical protein